MVVAASTYSDVLEDLEGISRIKKGAMGNCQLELSNAPHEFDAKPSSSTLYGIIRKNTDLKREDRS